VGLRSDRFRLELLIGHRHGIGGGLGLLRGGTAGGDRDQVDVVGGNGGDAAAEGLDADLGQFFGGPAQDFRRCDVGGFVADVSAQVTAGVDVLESRGGGGVGEYQFRLGLILGG